MDPGYTLGRNGVWLAIATKPYETKRWRLQRCRANLVKIYD